MSCTDAYGEVLTARSLMHGFIDGLKAADLGAGQLAPRR
jgi:hypothetical protein